MSWMIDNTINFGCPSGSPHTRTPAPAASLAMINEEMNHLCVPYNINENVLTDFLARLDACEICADIPERWLLTARLAEMTILVSGYYADNAEFQCAGDLLFNPRKILIFIKGETQPALKRRHGRLSTQLADGNSTPGAFARWFKHHADLKIVRRPLLPDLLERMTLCGRFSAPYLDSIHARMRRVADTIAFLSSWGVCGFEDLHQRLQSLKPGDRAWIESNLCRFDRGRFDLLGEDIAEIAGGRAAAGCG